MSGCCSAISAADSTPVRPPPATTTVAAAEPIQLVGQRHGVLRAVERVGELVDAGNDLGIGDTAERVDQGVVAQFVLVVDANGLRIGVDGRHPALDEVHVGTGEPVGNLQIAPGPGRTRSGAAGGVR